jgi:galactokinase
MSHIIDPKDLAARFEKAYGSVPRIFVGPGRINIIGEHVDYCGGMVMPAAIDRACYVACAPNGLTILRVESDFGSATIGLNTFAKHDDWRDYVAGMAFALMADGIAVSGHDMIIQSNVPVGAGVSSSAALEVGVGLSLCGGMIDGPRLAQIAQRAENHYAGMNCGIMDQFASANGIADHAILLDCATLNFQPVAVPNDACFLLIDSGVKHSHVDSEYRSRRNDCEAGASALGIGLLCEVTQLTALEVLTGNQLKRARHVVSEIARTKAACKALAQRDLEALGALMNQSHASLSANMEVSTPEVDRLAAIAQATDGVYGARMMGGGFGGSVIALVDRAHVSAARMSMVRIYEDYIGEKVDAFDVSLAQGAHEVFWQGKD